MTYNAPGKAHREGITLLQLSALFPDEDAARKWFEGIFYAEGRFCPRCGTDNNYSCKHKKMPYRCRDCKSYFSVKTGTAMEGSPIPLLKWLYAIYLDLTSLKGVSSMKIHRDLGVSQSAAWFMLQRIREGFKDQGPEVKFDGPVEVDETYVGGLRKNMSKAQRAKLEGRGPVGKTAVIGVKDRKTGKVAARVVRNTDGETLRGFVHEHTAEGAEVFTDDASGYRGLPNHETVKHSVGEYVAGRVHTNSIESFWSMLKRAHKGTFHKLSPKHLQRYVNEFAGRENIRDLDTISQMAALTAGLAAKRLTYRDLIADNGLPSGARSA
ncbi:MAG: IS1595 family transposase [Acidobacteria bacterium]|nr:IS1595 family transposase [Acidobacteriota bacterium]